MAELVDALSSGGSAFGRGGSTPLMRTNPDIRKNRQGFLFLSMFFVYALKSLNRNYIYIGMTSELEVRIKRHNEGKNRTTKPYSPFVLIYTKEFETRIEARKHEKYMKSGSGREFLKGI